MQDSENDLEESLRWVIERLSEKFDRDRLAELFDRYKKDPAELLAGQYRNGISLVGLAEVHGLASGHQLAKRILQPLHSSVGLDYVCLELESFLQPEIDQYLATGDEKHLRKVIDREKELIECGYPTQGRIDHDYFDIVREAKRLDIKVLLVDDNHDKDTGDAYLDLERRDIHMEEVTPNDGKILFYCGGFHLPLIAEIRRGNDPHSKIHLMRQVAEGLIEGSEERLFSESLSGKHYAHPVAVNFGEHRDLSQLLQDNILMAQLLKRADSVVYHP